MNIVLLMIEKGATEWNEGLVHACKGGHYQLVLLMIKKGADAWSYGLHNTEDPSIALLMIEKGADINRNNVRLSQSGIIRLIKLGFKTFGEQKILAYICGGIIHAQREILRLYFIDDLVSVIQWY